MSVKNLAESVYADIYARDAWKFAAKILDEPIERCELTGELLPATDLILTEDGERIAKDVWDKITAADWDCQVAAEDITEAVAEGRIPHEEAIDEAIQKLQALKNLCTKEKP